MFKKPIALSLVALLVGSGVVSTTAFLLVGGSPALAASKSVTCPDNTTGVTDGSWTLLCTGQTAAAATVTITRATSTSVSLVVRPATTDTFANASGSYNGTDATVQITYGVRAGGSQVVSITVTHQGGAGPQGVVISNPNKNRQTNVILKDN